MLSLITRTLLLKVQPSPMAQPSYSVRSKVLLGSSTSQAHVWTDTAPLTTVLGDKFFFFLHFPEKKNRSHARLKVTKYVKYEMIHPSLDFVHYVPMWERSNATSLTTFNHTFIPKSYIFVPDDHRLF